MRHGWLFCQEVEEELRSFPSVKVLITVKIQHNMHKVWSVLIVYDAVLMSVQH